MFHHPATYRQQTYHYCAATTQPALTCQYVLLLDALNFCFWPLESYQYVHLASSLKHIIETEPTAFDAENLIRMTAEKLQAWLLCTFHPNQTADGTGAASAAVSPKIPLLDERVRLIQEIGAGLLRHFDGQAINMILQARHSASRLLDLLTATFPGFRDHCILDGHQVFLYKRAQIFIGDLWGAFDGQGLGRFDDIAQLTCFADYRVPQLLRHLGS